MNIRNSNAMSGLLTRVLTELWAFSVDTFADSGIKVMTENDAQAMMDRILDNN